MGGDRCRKGPAGGGTCGGGGREERGGSILEAGLGGSSCYRNPGFLYIGEDEGDTRGGYSTRGGSLGAGGFSPPYVHRVGWKGTRPEGGGKLVRKGGIPALSPFTIRKTLCQVKAIGSDEQCGDTS